MMPYAPGPLHAARMTTALCQARSIGSDASERLPPASAPGGHVRATQLHLVTYRNDPADAEVHPTQVSSGGAGVDALLHGTLAEPQG